MLGEANDVEQLVSRHSVDWLRRCDVGSARGSCPSKNCMHVKLSGVPVEEAATTYERMTGKLMLENLRPSSLIFSDGFRRFRWHRVLKRAADIVLVEHWARDWAPSRWL